MSIDARIYIPPHRQGGQPFPLDYLNAILRAESEAEQREILAMVPEPFLDLLGRSWVDIDVRRRIQDLRRTAPQRAIADMRRSLGVRG